MKRYPAAVNIIDRGLRGPDVLCNPQPCLCADGHFLRTLASLACFRRFRFSVGSCLAPSRLDGMVGFSWREAVFPVFEPSPLFFFVADVIVALLWGHVTREDQGVRLLDV